MEQKYSEAGKIQDGSSGLKPEKFNQIYCSPSP